MAEDDIRRLTTGHPMKSTLMALDYNRIFIKHVRKYYLKNSLDMVLTMGYSL